MRPATQQYATRRDTLVFAACIVLSILIRFSPGDVKETLAAGIRNTVLAPLLLVQKNAELQKNSRFRYSQVVTERDSLAVAVMRLREASAENDRLRELLRLSDAIPVRHVPAEVLHQSAPTNGLTAVLSVGRQDGVTILSPVISPSGLVGVIQSIDERTSVVAMWPHPEFRVNVMTEDGALFGNAQAAPPTGPDVQLMEVTGVSYRDSVAVGTPVYTSGLGGIWPRGVAVGTVLSEAATSHSWERTYLVLPSVHPASLSHVIVLLGPTTDAREMFARDSADAP